MLSDTHGWNATQLYWRLFLMRTRCNLTQTELAYRAGLSRNIITKLESGGHADAKLSTLVAVSNVMRMPMHAWFLPEDEWRKWYDFNIPQENE